MLTEANPARLDAPRQDAAWPDISVVILRCTGSCNDRAKYGEVAEYRRRCGGMLSLKVDDGSDDATVETAMGFVRELPVGTLPE